MQNPLALWHTSPEKSEIKQAASFEISGEICEIQSLYSLVSTGTERLVATGKIPTGLYNSMQVPYMEGDFSLPVKYGYSLVGEVVKGPLLGKTVHLLHPHQDYCKVAAADVFPIPDEVPAVRATLASNLETAVNAVWDSGVSVGDRVAVVGFGIIGSLVARLLAQLPAVSLTILEKDPDRIKMAKSMGFEVSPNENLSTPLDIAFHCSSTAAGLQTCIDTVGLEGKVIELSWYGDKSVELNLGGTFHPQRKVIISSQVSQIPASHQHRWDFRRRKEAVFELLKNPDFDLHTPKTTPFTNLPEVFSEIRKGSSKQLVWIVDYQ